MRGKKEDDDTVMGRKYRARAEAQNRARKRLRKEHAEEYAQYYQESLIEVFKERGLGTP